MEPMDRPIAAAQMPEEAEPTSDTILHGLRLTAARLAWVAVALLAVALFVSGSPIAYDQTLTVCVQVDCPLERLLPEDAEALRDLGLSERFYAWYITALVSVFALSFILVAALIFWRRSNDWMAMLSSVGLVSFGTSWTDVPRSLVTANPEWGFAHVFVFLLGFMILFLLFYLFPDGRFAPRWTRFVGFLWIAATAAFFVGSVVRQDYLLENVSTLFDVMWSLLLLVVIIVGVYGQVYRFARYATPAQRQQSKWVMVGLTTAVLLATVGISLQATVLSDPGLPRLMGNLVVVPLLFVIPGMLVPGAIGMSIMRYRLWDIDVVVNRALVYGALTATLVGGYIGLVVALQAAFRAVTDQAGPMTFVISTLAIAALFLPLRRRIQDLIDRRLYRRKYDAFRTLEALSVSMRDQVDLGSLKDLLLAAVRGTVQPSYVSLRLLETSDAEDKRWVTDNLDVRPAPTW